jgi:SAM-dependent methyltransferase
MIDEYVTMCDTVFAGLGVRFSADELANLKTVLAGQLAEAYTASQRSRIVISYESPVGTMLNYHVKPEWQTVASAYDNWVATRQPPLFGTEPDARVLALAGDTADPRACRVLDIGAGTGRNTLALARRGHPVDAVEMTPKFADIIRAEAAQQALDVRVIQRDVFTGMQGMHSDYRLMVLSEVVSDFRTTQQLRGMFELAARCLMPGGRLVFNTFLPRPGRTVDDAARELGQQVYTTIFTRDELANAAGLLPLTLVGEDSVYEYEKTHLPDGVWPPTSWYADWVSGLDVFDVDRETSPIEMRWLVYQKAGGP